MEKSKDRMKFYLKSLPSFLGKMPLNVEYS